MGPSPYGVIAERRPERQQRDQPGRVAILDRRDHLGEAILDCATTKNAGRADRLESEHDAATDRRSNARRRCNGVLSPVVESFAGSVSTAT